MNQAIADIIKGQIEGLDFVDKIAGLVSTVYLDVTDKNNTLVQKSFPVACCVSADDCKQGAYNDLMPNSQYKTVIYFEDGGVSFDKYESHWKYYTSKLRLVCWINVARILGDTCKSGSVCTLSAHLITEIIRELPEFPVNDTPFHRLYFEIVNQAVRDNSIFGKYTFDEKHIQYLMYPYDYFALDIETHFSICLDSDVVPAPCDDVIEQMTPVAEAATDETCTGFTAHWVEETEATGYYLDVSTVSTFASFVSGYNNLDVGNVTNYIVTVPSEGTYYYRTRSYDDTATSANSNTITVTTLYCDWFLPSIDELTTMFGVTEAGLDGRYWSSSEIDATNVWSSNGPTGLNATPNAKTTTFKVRALREFTSTTVYATGDTGPAGGIIVYKNGNDYLEAAPSDQSASKAWSNITDVAVTGTATGMGTGQANTTAIIGQIGHVTSAAKLCDDLTV